MFVLTKTFRFANLTPTILMAIWTGLAASLRPARENLSIKKAVPVVRAAWFAMEPMNR